MDNESEIVRLLTEIRDNQQKQMEWVARTQSPRRAVIALAVIVIGLTLLLGACLMK